MGPDKARQALLAVGGALPYVFRYVTRKSFFSLHMTPSSNSEG